MIIPQLGPLPKEDDLTKILFDIFSAHPKILSAFLALHGSVSDFGQPIVAKSWKETPSGKPDMYFEDDTHLVIFENKMKAGFTKEQLPRYLEVGRILGKKSQYFLIAPDTSRYKPGIIPPEYTRLTWDDMHDFLSNRLSEMDQEHQLKITCVLSRYRYLYFCNLFGDLYHRVSSQSNISSPKLFSKDDYHSRHITIRGFTNLKFSIGIYLDGPSYLKLNPWWVRSGGKNYKIIETHKPVRMFRDELYKLPGTRHSLEHAAPGYVVDIQLTDSNTPEVIANEIVDLLNNQCQHIISLYRGMFS